MNTLPVTLLVIVLFGVVFAEKKSYDGDCGKDCEDEDYKPICACRYKKGSGSSGSGYGGSGYGGSGYGGSGYGGSGYGGSSGRKECKTFDNKCELESANDCGEGWEYEYKGKCKKYED